ncbi:hypothetical protein KJA15_00655 [Patescibacteria group bacterium]|nr:hypothetical protein [Patescibacteria group bacterium]
MKIDSLKPKQRQKEHFLTLDIGTEAIKALIFSTSVHPAGYGGKESEKIIVLGASTQYFDQLGVWDSRDFEQSTIKKALSIAIKKTQTQAKTKINSLLLSLPANILRGEILFLNLKRKNPKEIIRKSEESQILKEVLNQAKKELSQKIAQELGILSEDLHFCNLKILEIKIDGYEVPSVLELGGKNLDFRILATFSPKYYLENIKKIFKDLNLKILKIVHQSEGLISFENKKENAIFLDVGGELTQTFLFKRGKLEGISQFKGGGIDFTKKLSQILGLSLGSARALKHSYSRGMLSWGVRKRVKGIFFEDLQIWFKNLKETFKKISLINTKSLLPSNFLLFGGGSQIPEIQEILERGNWEDFPFISQPKVKLVLPKDLRGIEDKSQILNSPQDTAPILICLS